MICNEDVAVYARVCAAANSPDMREILGKAKTVRPIQIRKSFAL